MAAIEPTLSTGFDSSALLATHNSATMSIEDMVTDLFKLAMLGKHQNTNIQRSQKELEKKTSIVLRDNIRESHNSWTWMASAVLGMGINVAGLGAFGYAAMNVDANAAKAALEAAQLASGLTSPVTQYFQQRDEAGRGAMQSEQQLLNSQSGTTSQEISGGEQNEEQLRQQMQAFYDKVHQAFGEQSR